MVTSQLILLVQGLFISTGPIKLCVLEQMYDEIKCMLLYAVIIIFIVFLFTAVI